jgi:hypothetical protein
LRRELEELLVKLEQCELDVAKLRRDIAEAELQQGVAYFHRLTGD